MAKKSGLKKSDYLILGVGAYIILPPVRDFVNGIVSGFSKGIQTQSLVRTSNRGL